MHFDVARITSYHHYRNLSAHVILYSAVRILLFKH